MKEPDFPVTSADAKRAGIDYDSTSNYYASFPSRLRQLRKASKLSQQKAADRLGVSKSTIGLWENGETLPDAKNVTLLAKIYNVTTDYLLCQTDSPTNNENIRGLCDYLGLSGYAASRLSTIANHYPDMMKTLGLLIESEFFSPILKSLQACIHFGNTKTCLEYVLEKHHLMPKHIEGEVTEEEVMVKSDKEAYRARALYEPQRLLGLFAEELIRASEKEETASGAGGTESGHQGR